MGMPLGVPWKAEKRTSIFMVPNFRPAGIVQAGNLDLTRRPDVPNPFTGGRSSVWSMGISRGGKEVLIPRVSEGGKVMTEEEAIAEYDRTGNHLGIFASIEAAETYAEALHLYQEALTR